MERGIWCWCEVFGSGVGWGVWRWRESACAGVDASGQRDVGVVALKAVPVTGSIAGADGKSADAGAVAMRPVVARMNGSLCGRRRALRRCDER